MPRPRRPKLATSSLVQSMLSCYVVSGSPPTSLSLCGLVVNGLKATVHFAQGGPDTGLPNPGPSPTSPSPSPPTTSFSNGPYSTWPGRVEVVLPDSVSLQFPFEVVILAPWAGGNSGKKAARTAAGARAELGSRLSGADLGRLLSARHIVSLQQIFPWCCYKASIWQITAGLRARARR